jgi:hypothetical protein
LKTDVSEHYVPKEEAEALKKTIDNMQNALKN